MDNQQDTIECQTCDKRAVFIYSRMHTAKRTVDNSPVANAPPVPVGEEKYYRCPKGHVSRVRDY
jgi:hypothetical protein